MASYVPPVKNGANGCIFYLSLPSVASAGSFQANPTLASGDVKVSVDGGSLANITTLPTVTPAAGKMVKVTLSQAEVNGDNITIVFSDAAGNEWTDTTINIQTTARQIDDLAFPTVSGRSLDITTTGEAGIDWSNIGAPTTTVNLSGTNINATQKVDVDTIKTQALTAAAGITFPTSIASPTNITAGTITTATNLTNAPTSGDFTATMKTSLNAATPSVTVSDKTGFSLSSAGVQAIWDALTSALTTVGSIGKLLVTNIDATISGRMATYTQPTGFLAATFPGTVASSTNITAGTITTVTNLTNAATSGDLTTTMKASVTAAVPTANANADALLDRSAGVETGVTPRQWFRLAAAALFGKASGLATTTAKFRDTGDSKDRITATVDADGNRSAVTLDAS